MRRFALPGAVLLALVAVFAVAWGTRPAASGATVKAGQAAAVTSITRSCPPSAPGSSTARISMVALPSQAAAGSGTAAATGAATFSAVPRRSCRHRSVGQDLRLGGREGQGRAARSPCPLQARSRP